MLGLAKGAVKIQLRDSALRAGYAVLEATSHKNAFCEAFRFLEFERLFNTRIPQS